MITIPFSDPMEEANSQLKKTCTTRSKKYGEPGDTFQSGGYVFKLVEVTPFVLGFVGNRLYRLEGCEHPDDFVKLWRSLHDGDYPFTETYWSHFYVPVGKVEPAAVLRLKVEKIEATYATASKIEKFELYLNGSLKTTTVSLKEIHLLVEDARMIAETIGLQLIDDTDEKLKRRIYGEK